MTLSNYAKAFRKCYFLSQYDVLQAYTKFISMCQEMNINFQPKAHQNSSNALLCVGRLFAVDREFCCGFK